MYQEKCFLKLHTLVVVDVGVCWITTTRSPARDADFSSILFDFTIVADSTSDNCLIFLTNYISKVCYFRVAVNYSLRRLLRLLDYGFLSFSFWWFVSCKTLDFLTLSVSDQSYNDHRSIFRLY